MGFFDSLKNKAFEKMAERYMSSPEAKQMMEQMMSGKGSAELENLAKDPSLAKLAEQMKSGADAGSLTPQQIEVLLQHPMLKSLTSKMGLTPDQLAKQLSATLPALMKQFGPKK